MKSITFLILITSLLFVSCSKKDPGTNLSGNNQQKQPVQNNTTSTGSASYYNVSNVSSDVKKNQLIDFSWNENGQEKKLSDFKGKVIVVNFWATWCGPCKHELPDLSKISQDLKDKDFKMVGVSVDQNLNQLESFLKSNSLSYLVVHESSSLLPSYMSATGMTDDVIPQTFVIDKSGKIVETLIGSHSKEDFMKVINKYL
jgi:thiol-disulfide isomerase/thioredoxin